MLLMKTTAPASLGDYIKEKRTQAEMLQKDLAQRIGCAQASLSYWEAGTFVPSAKAIVAIARELPGASAKEMLDLLAGEGTK